MPLQTSIRYANVAISLFDVDGKSYIYGYVPIVVAKCGVFLKEKGNYPCPQLLKQLITITALDIEGIFRLSGSEKRIKELKASFDSPTRYGKGLDWTGYTVHDAANILRRYFNQLPEPIIPLEFYEDFRNPLRNHQAQAVGKMDLQAPSEGDFDLDSAIKTYQKLITHLPPLNRQLLLYILDLLAVFASKSDLNKMNTPNLAAIFQPGILSHPSHDMSPPDYRLSQDVLIFLIENQDHFIIGMQGTEADEKTVQEIQSGPPTPKLQSGPRTPPTTMSAGAESVRAYGGLRRNVSTSSHHSKSSLSSPGMVAVGPGASIAGGASPRLVQNAPNSPSSSVHRSNTLPLKRSPGIAPAKFSREKVPEPLTPNSVAAEEPRRIDDVDSDAEPPVTVAATPLPDGVAEVAMQGSGGENPSRTSQRLETIPQQPVEEERESISPDSRFNTRIAAAIAPAGAEKIAAPAVAEGRPQTELAVSIADPALSSSSALDGPPKSASSSVPQSAGSASPGKSLAAMLPKLPASDLDRKETRRPNKLQKKRNAGSAAHSARSSTHSLHGQGQGQSAPPPPTTTTLVAMGPENPGTAAQAEGNDSYQQQQQQQTTEGSNRSGAGGLRPNASPSPSPSFHSRSSVTDVTDTEMATGDEGAGYGVVYGGGSSNSGTGSGTTGTMATGGGTSSLSSPPKTKKKRWRFSAHSSAAKHAGKSNADGSRSGSHGSSSVGGDGVGAEKVAEQRANIAAVATGSGAASGAAMEDARKESVLQEEEVIVTEQLRQERKVQQQQQQREYSDPSTQSGQSVDPLSSSSATPPPPLSQTDKEKKHSSSALEWFRGKLSDRKAERHFNRTKSPPGSGRGLMGRPKRGMTIGTGGAVGGSGSGGSNAGAGAGTGMPLSASTPGTAGAGSIPTPTTPTKTSPAGMGSRKTMSPTGLGIGIGRRSEKERARSQQDLAVPSLGGGTGGGVVRDDTAGGGGGGRGGGGGASGRLTAPGQRGQEAKDGLPLRARSMDVSR